MALNSIEQLKAIRGTLRKSLRLIKVKDYPNQTFGTEHEYDAKSLKDALDSILTDLSGLIASEKKCLQVTSRQDRQDLFSNLNQINNHLNQKRLNNIIGYLDHVKPILRNSGVRYWTERVEAADEIINKQQQKILELYESIETFNETLKELSAIDNSIHDINERVEDKQTNISELHQELIALTTETKNLRKEIQDGIEQDTNNSSKIKAILDESKIHSEVINTFSEKIAQRENQLEDQKTKTEEYSKKLLAFEEKHENYLEQAENLITEAENSLQLSATEGISSAFNRQYEEAKTTGRFIWITGAAIFVLIAIIISLDIFGFVNISELLGIRDTDVKANNINGILARFLLIPIPLTVAWFCAMQYVKQKNIIEDYAYKSVLAKSLVGFSNQLSTETNKGEDYTYFIQSVFNELHKDPLRKHHKESCSVKSFRRFFCKRENDTRSQ